MRSVMLGNVVGALPQGLVIEYLSISSLVTHRYVALRFGSIMHGQQHGEGPASHMGSRLPVLWLRSPNNAWQ